MPDQDEHNEISRLLRLKKYEQPEAQYFETFLQEFHRRQRAEVLQPLWRIALDRFQMFFGESKSDLYGYGAAAAAAVVLFLGVVNFEARTQDQSTAAVLKGPVVDTRTASSDTRTEHPRYVIDTRPVSYNEPPFSF